MAKRKSTFKDVKIKKKPENKIFKIKKNVDVNDAYKKEELTPIKNTEQIEVPKIESPLENALTLLINSQVQTQEILNKIATWIDELKNKKPEQEHQLDLDQESRIKPFKMKFRYDIEVRTLDLWDWLFEYENTWKRFFNRQEAIDYGTKTYGPGRFRILQIEQPVSFNS